MARRAGRDTIVVAAALAQRPSIGGHAWVILNYLLGLRRLGYEVLLVDHLPAGLDVREGAAWARAVLEPFGLWDDYALDGGDAWVGRPAGTVRGLVRDSAALLNVMGYLPDGDLRREAPTTVFVDIDPGFPQLWFDEGLADVLSGHDHYLTVGTNVGAPGCTVPPCGVEWKPMLPPVVLEHWPARPVDPAAPVTSVATWRGPFGPVPRGGQVYGLRVHEFRRLLPLPSFVRARFELALDIDESDSADASALSEHGWHLVSPRGAAGTPAAYAAFVAGSLAEFQVAKNLYVATGGGWFSDRTACYLASGRPAVVQDTGLPAHLLSGEGLLTYTTLDEAAGAVGSVLDDPHGQGMAARRFAEEHLDSDLVLSSALGSCGVA